MRQDVQGANPNGKTPFEKDIYFYHPDHLGSSSYITDLNGKLYEALVYFPFGEGWIEENTNVQRTPYHFTAKELDEETGLYYFGARYYDPRTSVWQSPDRILGRYLPNAMNVDDQLRLVQNAPEFYPYVNLPGRGGVYQSHNLNLYQYAAQNPLLYVDPDGNLLFYWHFAISFSEARKGGLGFWNSLAVGWHAMLHDFRGTQGTDAASVNSHGMKAIIKDPVTGELRPQTDAEAAAGTEKFITESLEKGTNRGLGEATHPEADKPAGGHHGKVWEGFRKLGLWGSLKHIGDGLDLLEIVGGMHPSI